MKPNIKRHQFEVGDRVKYSRNFLRSTGQFTGPIPFARGAVTSLEPFGGEGRALVTVEWDKGDAPSQVLNMNLVCENYREAG